MKVDVLIMQQNNNSNADINLMLEMLTVVMSAGFNLS